MGVLLGKVGFGQQWHLPETPDEDGELTVTVVAHWQHGGRVTALSRLSGVSCSRLVSRELRGKWSTGPSLESKLQNRGSAL